MEHTTKKYKCSECGYISEQKTNHFGPTWSWGHVNCCPNCLPYKKYPEFSGSTLWNCEEKEVVENKENNK